MIDANAEFGASSAKDPEMNRQAIQAAIDNAAVFDADLVVSLSPGEYRISGPLNFTDGVTILGMSHQNRPYTVRIEGPDNPDE